MENKETAKTPTNAEMETYVDAGYTVADIATAEAWSVAKVRYWLKKYDLKASTETKSIGHKSFRTLLQREFPTYPINEEYHIGNRLMLDFYIPAIHVAFEIDGKQHEEVDDLFHSGSWEIFRKQTIRDIEKEKRCIDKGILLIRIPADLAQEAVRDNKTSKRLFKGIRNKIAAHEPPDKDTSSKHTPVRYNDYREKMKKLGRDARRKNYRQAKEIKRRRKEESIQEKKTVFGA